jgi:VanZ family protein
VLKKHKFFFLAFIWTAVIACLSFVNTAPLPKVGLTYSDKIGHMFFYCILTFLWVLYFFFENKYAKNKALFCAAIIAFFYGTAIELLQAVLTNYRTGDFFDGLANTFGIVIAVVISMRFVRSNAQVK